MTKRANLPPVPRGWARCRLCGKPQKLEEFGWNKERGQFYKTCRDCLWRYSVAQTARLKRLQEQQAETSVAWRLAWIALGLPLVAKGKNGRKRKQA